MKHVVTGAPRPWRVLVTGFGAFPGTPRNPAVAILRRLERSRARLARLGIALTTTEIPVVYADIDAALETAVAAHAPDAILHLGVAGRRRRISVETRAVNRAGPLHPDALRRLPVSPRLVHGGTDSVVATWPAAQIGAAIRGAGIAAQLSIDAGDYVCNATLYRSLATKSAAQVGFLHVPRVRKASQPQARTRTEKPTIDQLMRAAFAAILVMARQRRSLVPAEKAAPTALSTGDAPKGPSRPEHGPAADRPAASPG